MIEVKDGEKSPSKRRLTPQQQEFKAGWRGSIIYLDNVRDVPDIVKAFRKV